MTALAVLRDGRLASGGDDGVVLLWEVPARTSAVLLDESEDDNGVTALTVLPDGRLACGMRDNTIHLCDVHTATHSGMDARVHNTARATLEGHRDGLYVLVALPGGRLAGSGADDTVRLWNLPPARWGKLQLWAGCL